MTDAEMTDLFNPPEAFGNPKGLFHPYVTMFKLHIKGRTVFKETTVSCVNCNANFPLQDLLTNELEEDQCPKCEVWARQYWADKPSRSVPNA
jgi:hypothetical protein